MTAGLTLARGADEADPQYRAISSMSDEVYDEPSVVEAINGLVAVKGPSGIVVLMTPGAALETSDRLHEAAVTAQGQKRFAHYQPDPGESAPIGWTGPKPT